MTTRFSCTLALASLIVAWTLGGLRAPAHAAQTGTGTQTDAEVAVKSAGCLTCHAPDSTTMHVSKVQIGCTDCHGGDATAMRAQSAAPGSREFLTVKTRAHAQPRLGIWKTSANPVRSGATTLEESAEFIRFVNPGDLRVAGQTCVPCHTNEVNAVRR